LVGGLRAGDGPWKDHWKANQFVLELLTCQAVDTEDPAQLALLDLSKEEFADAAKSFDGVTQSSLAELLSTTQVGYPAKGFAGGVPKNKSSCIGLLVELAPGTL
jgi:hypothetical protein